VIPRISVKGVASILIGAVVENKLLRRALNRDGTLGCCVRLKAAISVKRMPAIFAVLVVLQRSPTRRVIVQDVDHSNSCQSRNPTIIA
jgi:hypothetical protein